MKDSVKKEIENLIEEYSLDCDIEEFENYINWKYFSRYETLSEDFIREFQDKVNWKYISKYQRLSEDFIREFNNKVESDGIMYYQKISDELKKEIKNGNILPLPIIIDLFPKINRSQLIDLE